VEGGVEKVLNEREKIYVSGRKGRGINQNRKIPYRYEGSQTKGRYVSVWE